MCIPTETQIYRIWRKIQYLYRYVRIDTDFKSVCAVQVPAEQQFHTEASWSLECSASSSAAGSSPPQGLVKAWQCQLLQCQHSHALLSHCARQGRGKKRRRKGQVSASAGAFPLA